jgi:putative acetyltransferase
MNGGGSNGVRRERPGDEGAIRAVIAAAFGGAAEADVVEHLRADGGLILGLVHESGGGIVGYVAFARLTVAVGEGTAAAAGLAPLAVAPSHQNRGVGSLLVRAGLDGLKQHGERIVFVLGDPAYYGRFGFAVMDGFVSRYAGPYFQALRLAADAPASGRVTYPKAFDGL